MADATTGDLGGTNQYAVRANTSSGPNARVYGINDISIFTNQSGISTLNVAEVAQVHAGKTLELKFYDAGEDDDDAWMTVKRPNGTTATCDWVAKNEAGSTQDSGSGSCSIQTSDGNPLFQGTAGGRCRSTTLSLTTARRGQPASSATRSDWCPTSETSPQDQSEV
jgi:hypothetical protein